MSKETEQEKPNTPNVSVIIPTCNRAEMVRRAIESVRAQTWQGDMEIIVVSDGSTDNTEETVASFDDSRIRFFKHKTSRGASAARNAGLRASRGKYIAFLDDDDEWTRDKLEVQMPVIEKSDPRIGLVYAWMECKENGERLYVHSPELRGDVFEQMLDGQVVGGCPTVIIKREVLDLVPGFDEELRRGNDGDFYRRISEHYHVDYVPKVLAHVHFGHADRISIDNRRNLEAVIFALEKRLGQFQGAYVKYPERKVSVLIQIMTSCLKTGHLLKAIRYSWQALCSQAKWSYKIDRFWWLIKNQILFWRAMMMPRNNT